MPCFAYFIRARICFRALRAALFAERFFNFILENRIRVEKWNTNPSTQFYFVMNEDDESIAKELDGRDAVDAAIKYFEELESDQN